MNDVSVILKNVVINILFTDEREKRYKEEKERVQLLLICLIVCGANVGSMEAKQRPGMAATHNSIINPTSTSRFLHYNNWH